MSGRRWSSKISRDGARLRSLAIFAVAAGVACHKDAVIDQRVVTLYTLADPPKTPQTASACGVPNAAYALYSAAGDFEPDSTSPPQEGHLLDGTRPELDALPTIAQQLSVDVRLDTRRWRGFGRVPASGNVDLLVWPVGHECQLTTSVDPRPGSTMTAYDDHHVLVTGGAGLASFVLDLDNGSVVQLSNAQDIGSPRQLATATAFSGGVVVAGGESGNIPTPNAEVFDTKSGSFSGDPITLAQARGEQGAVLLANGDVLLVGGVAADGGLFSSCVAIDPVQRHASSAGLASLQVARANPTVLRLASGELLVLGGTGAGGKPISSVEWISKDATQNTGLAAITSSEHETFVALPAGGALAVVSPDTPGPTTAWVITPDHQIQQAASIASLPAGANVRLFDGAGGAPLLWSGSNWFRWSPWLAAFTPLYEATSADGTSTASGPDVDAITLSADAGLAIWLENSGISAGRVLGLRFDARGIYTTDVKTLLATDTDAIAPDRMPTTVTPDASGSTLVFDPESGLTLGKNASVVVSDATFANFSLDLDTIQLGTPILFLRDGAANEVSIGTDPGSTCVVPDAGHFHVVRNGAAVVVTSQSASAADVVTRCNTALASTTRVSIGLRAHATSGAPSTVRNLVVRR